MVFEKPSKIDSPTFLHLFNRNEKLKHIGVFKLDPKFIEDGKFFIVRICPDENFLENLKHPKDCYDDIYSTIITFDDQQKIPVQEMQFRNSYKLCNFGFFYPEVNKSFVSSTLDELLNSSTLSNSEISYQDTDLVVTNAMEAKEFKPMKDARANADFQCHLQINSSEKEFNLENFTGKINYQPSLVNYAGVLTLAYKFNPGTQLKSRWPLYDQIVKGRDSASQAKFLKNKLKTQAKFEVMEYLDSQLAIDIDSSTSPGSLTLQVSENNTLFHKFKNTFNIQIDKPRILVVLFCNKMITKEDAKNYSLLSKSYCAQLRPEANIRIEPTSSGFKFDVVGGKRSNPQSAFFNANIWNIIFEEKEKKDGVDVINRFKTYGIEKKCDLMKDSIDVNLFLICYYRRRQIVKIDGKEEELLVPPTTAELEANPAVYEMSLDWSKLDSLKYKRNYREEVYINAGLIVAGLIFGIIAAAFLFTGHFFICLLFGIVAIFMVILTRTNAPKNALNSGQEKGMMAQFKGWLQKKAVEARLKSIEKESGKTVKFFEKKEDKDYLVIENPEWGVFDSVKKWWNGLWGSNPTEEEIEQAPIWESFDKTKMSTDKKEQEVMIRQISMSMDDDGADDNFKNRIVV